VNRLTYLELGKIGNNLNQLARAVHHARSEGDACAIDPQDLEDLRNMLGEIRLQVMNLDFGIANRGEP